MKTKTQIMTGVIGFVLTSIALNSFGQTDCKNTPYKIPGSLEELQLYIDEGKTNKAINSYLAKTDSNYICCNFHAGTCKDGTTHCSIKETAEELGLTPNSPVVTVQRKGPENDITMQTFGKHAVVEGYKQKSFFVDEEFVKYLVSDKWYCLGRPIENTQFRYCELCKIPYKTQEFFYKGFNDGIVWVPKRETGIVVGGEECRSPFSRTGNHDSLILDPIPDCGDPSPCDSHGASFNRNRIKNYKP